MTVTAHQGDCKTLLAFDFDSDDRFKALAGFTVECKPDGQPGYFLNNTLRFADPSKHAQDLSLPAQSTINAPIHKLRWVHVPGSAHQGTKPFFGKYTYTVTPRYFDNRQSLMPLDRGLSVSMDIGVGPFRKGCLAMGFTRGYTQSQGFTHNFGVTALIRPKGNDLLFDTSVASGQDAQGHQYSFADEYAWLGLTARDCAMGFLDTVLADKQQFLSVFAYDLNEPDVCKRILQLASEGRARVILDNAALHHSTVKPTPEDAFEQAFLKAARGPAAILRGKFARYAHDKVFVSFTKDRALRVLTGSTNFSVTGMYVNSNHVLVFDDSALASQYGELFEQVWAQGVKAPAFITSRFSTAPYVAAGATLPRTSITFAPHSPADAQRILGDVAARIRAEVTQNGKRSVLFAVMAVDQGVSPVYEALNQLHRSADVFSFGISDSKNGVTLYKPGTAQGVLVTGKPTSATLPPPFDQIRFIGGIGHQVHHKFVVCGFNGPDPVVYCGSSNLAVGGESANGDNLLEIRDADVATVFAIEAVTLVDHFHFLNSLSDQPKGPDATKTKQAASQQQAAEAAQWFLGTTDAWTKPYCDTHDLRYADRKLFAG